MPVQRLLPAYSKVSTLKPENTIVVENHCEGVLIRAARDNFSEKRKCFFIRHLAAEGYIHSQYEFVVELKLATDLWWLVDSSLLIQNQPPREAPVHQVLRVLLFAGLFLAALMAIAFMQAPR